MAVSHGNPVLDPLWERVCLIFDKWTDLLDLGWCNLILYRSDAASDDETAADCTAKWQYRQARLRVFLPALANHSDADIEEILVHELCHVLMNPVESLVSARKHEDQVELATENVARALLAIQRKLVG